MNTTTKILLALLVLSGITVGILTADNHAKRRTIETLQEQVARQSVALTEIRREAREASKADSLAFPSLTAAIPTADILRANRAQVKSVEAEKEPKPREVPEVPRSKLPTAVILHRGEAVPYDSAVVVEYHQYFYAARMASRTRTVELAVGARLPAVELPEVPTPRQIQRGKRWAFVGGALVGIVTTVAVLQLR